MHHLRKYTLYSHHSISILSYSIQNVCTGQISKIEPSIEKTFCILKCHVYWHLVMIELTIDWLSILSGVSLRNLKQKYGQQQTLGNKISLDTCIPHFYSIEKFTYGYNV